MEVEKKPPSVATTIQMEVAETMETFWMDSTQRWDNHESKATFPGFAVYHVNLNAMVVIQLVLAQFIF